MNGKQTKFGNSSNSFVDITLVLWTLSMRNVKETLCSVKAVSVVSLMLAEFEFVQVETDTLGMRYQF